MHSLPATSFKMELPLSAAKKINTILLLIILQFYADTIQAQNTLNLSGLNSSSPAFAAYSLRKLSDQYTGPAIRVAKGTAASNTETDIGFTVNGELDTVALQNFAPATGTVFVKIWYDQSGNGRNVSQNNIDSMPRIMFNGVIERTGDKPSVLFRTDGNAISRKYLYLHGITANYPVTISVVGNTNNQNSNGAFVKFGNDDRDEAGAGIAVGSGNAQFGQNGKNIVVLKEYGGWSYANPPTNLDASTFISTTVQGAAANTTVSWLNGQSLTLSGNAAPKGNFIAPSIYIGGYERASVIRYPVQLEETEIILFEQGLNNTQRINMECNQAEFYQIKMIKDVPDTLVCSGENYSHFVQGINNYSWNLPAVIPAGITGVTTGSGQPTFNQKLFNSSGVNQTITYEVSAGCGKPFTVLLTVRPTVAPSFEFVKDFCTLGNGQVILKTDSPGFSSYLWSNGATSDSVITVQAGIYSLTVTSADGCKYTDTVHLGTELVINGNFSQGRDVGYYTEYPYQNLPQNGPAYTINTNARNTHSNFWGKDHTSGTGNFMIVNGSLAPDIIIWQTRVKVEPNTRYYFSAWGMSLNNVVPFARLVFNVEGENVGSIAELPEGVSDNTNNGWTRFYGQWDSGTIDDSITIKIVNLVIVQGGNDFGLDDISFSTLPPVSMLGLTLGNGGNSVCSSSDNLQLQSFITGGSSPIDYDWTGPGGFNSNDANPLLSTPQAGLYQLTAIDANGCRADAAIDIKIGKPTLDSINNTKKCRSNYQVTLNGLIPNTINNHVYYYVSSVDSVKYRDTVLVNADASGQAIFTLPFTTWATNDSLVVDTIFNGSCKEEVKKWILLPNIPSGTNHTWIGPSSGSWHDAANWCPGIPTSTSYASIPTGTTVYISSLAICRRLQSTANNTTAKVVIQNGGLLRVTEFIDNGISPVGFVDARAGSIEFTRGSNLGLYPRYFKDSTVKTMIISHPANQRTFIEGAGVIKISEALLFGTANADFETRNRLVLLSSDTATARIGVLQSGNTIIDSVEVQRYISTPQKWQFLSVPVKTQQTFYQSWQENGANKPGYGTAITGPAAVPGPGGNGLDFTSSSYSLKYVTGNNFTFINNTNTPISTQKDKGYFIFVRGDRQILSSAANSKTLLRTKGVPEMQALNLSMNIPAGEWASIGNPYPSAINFISLQENNPSLDKTFQLWDPKSGGNYGLGGYVAFSEATDPPYMPVPASGTYENIEDNIRIESGHGFFVNSSAGDITNITFNETDKLAGSQSVSRGSVYTTESVKQQVTAALQISTGGNWVTSDETVVVFSESNLSDRSALDAKKIDNATNNIAVKKQDDQRLIIDARPALQQNDTIHYHLKGLWYGTYRLVFNTKNIHANMIPWLVDRFTGTKTPLSLNTATSFKFERLASQPLSASDDRFYVVFNTETVLPVRFISVNARLSADGGTLVTWNVNNEENITRYELERSSDGINFNSIQSVNADNSNEYTKSDYDLNKGTVFYRIKALEANNRSTYSMIVKVSLEKEQKQVIILANPVQQKQLKIKMIDLEPGSYHLLISDMQGNIVINKLFAYSGGVQVIQLPVSSIQTAGSYFVQISSKENVIKLSEPVLIP